VYEFQKRGLVHFPFLSKLECCWHQISSA